MKVSLLLSRRWFYHAVSVFLQSVLLLVVAYTTFYYRVDNFQDRMMVTITCMLVVANVQSSVGESIPKTSYFKEISNYQYILKRKCVKVGLRILQKCTDFVFTGGLGYTHS